MTYEVEWKHLNVSDFTAEELKHYSVNDIRKMFLRGKKHPMVSELAYLSFLINNNWGLNFDFEHGVQRILMQLRLPLFEGEGLSWKLKHLNPDRIWATEDSLDYDKLEMIKVALDYMEREQKPIPPIAVWLIKNEGRFNYVCHDGHHRLFLYAHKQKRIPVVEMEYWIDNRENPLLAQRLPYKKFDMLVSKMQIVKLRH
jgi:hypothetical protein